MNMKKERTEEFHINQYWLAFMQFAELLGSYIVAAGVPAEWIGWRLIATLTVLINLMPLLTLPSLINNITLCCKQLTGNQDTTVDVNKDFVRIKTETKDGKNDSTKEVKDNKNGEGEKGEGEKKND